VELPEAYEEQVEDDSPSLVVAAAPLPVRGPVRGSPEGSVAVRTSLELIRRPLDSMRTSQPLVPSSCPRILACSALGLVYASLVARNSAGTSKHTSPNSRIESRLGCLPARVSYAVLPLPPVVVLSSNPTQA